MPKYVVSLLHHYLAPEQKVIIAEDARGAGTRALRKRPISSMRRMKHSYTLIRDIEVKQKGKKK